MEHTSCTGLGNDAGKCGGVKAGGAGVAGGTGGGAARASINAGGAGVRGHASDAAHKASMRHLRAPQCLQVRLPAAMHISD